MATNPPPAAPAPRKGKSVGIWLTGEALTALEDLGKDNKYFRDGTYCSEAVVQRLQREGRIKSGTESEVAAQAFELSQAIGPEIVRAGLAEIAKKHAPEVQLTLAEVPRS